MLNITQCGAMPVTIVLGPVPACQFSGVLHKCKSSHWASSHQAKGLCPWWLSSVMQGKDPLCLTPIKSTNTHLRHGRGGNGSSSNTLHTDSEIQPCHRTTESMKLENASEMIESNLRLNTTMSTKPWHQVPRPSFFLGEKGQCQGQ